jgi:hypothetical protein
MNLEHFMNKKSVHKIEIILKIQIELIAKRKKI